MERKVQLEELDALQSIFFKEEFEIIESDFQKGIKVVFWAHQTLGKEFTIKFKENPETDDYSYIKINHLPPIELHVKLPKDYPTKCSPNFTLSCHWLTKSDISKLCMQLDKIWSKNENMEIIYIWADFLKNEALKFLGFENELDLTILYYYHLNLKRKRERHNTFEQNNIYNENQTHSSNCQGLGDSSSGNNYEKYKERRMVNFVQANNGKIFPYKSPHYFNLKPRDKKFNMQVEKKKHVLYDRRARFIVNSKTSPVKYLLSYNSEKENLEFQNKSFLCKICFTEKLGTNCLKFQNCNHIFCKACIQTYFNVQISDGKNPIKCPEIKCSSDATLLEVKDLVSEEKFKKYDSLLLRLALDSLGDVIYCPRITCQYPASKDSDENLAICPNCQYVFCIFCKKVYHGIEPCKLNSEERKQIIEKYLNAPKELKEQMEVRYGKKHILTLINNSMAETWIESNCKNCPKCNVSIEKSEGCNKMTCWKCSTYFCWLCSTVLDRANPYTHFSDSNSRCDNKLFYLAPFGEEEPDDYNSDDEQWHDWDWI